MKVYLILSGLAALIWSLQTFSVCREYSTREKCATAQTLTGLYSKYAPPKWKRFTRILIIVWVVLLLLVGFIFGWEA